MSEFARTLKDLKEGLPIPEIWLDSNLGDDGAIQLAEALTASSNVSTINSSENIGPKGIVALANAIARTKTVQRLSILQSIIGLEGAQALVEMIRKNSKLEDLDLWECQIDERIMKALVPGLLEANLIRITLNDELLTEKDFRIFLDALKSRRNLKLLLLGGGSLDTEGLDLWIAVIKNNKTLETLGLREYEVDLGGITALGEALENHNSLSKLILSGLGFRDEEAVTFARVLEHNKTITSLDLSQNQIGNEGFIALAEGLKKNTTLIELMLYNNKTISAQGVLAFTKALEHNTTLRSLEVKYDDTEPDLREKIDIALTDRDIQEVMSPLYNNPFETEVGWFEKRVGVKTLEALAEFCEQKNPPLEFITLSNCHISADGAKVLARILKSLPTLTQVNLGGNDQIGVDGAKALAEGFRTAIGLTDLCLYFTMLQSDGLKAILDALKENTSLQVLNLGCNDIGDEGAKHLAAFIKNNKTLMILHVESNSIGNVGAKALAEALEHNKTLVEVSFGKNSFDSQGFESICKGLQQHKILESFTFNDQAIDQRGMKALAQLIKQAKKLKSVDLRRARLGDPEAVILFEALAENNSIQQLELWCNNIGDLGIKALIKALKKRQTTLELSISSNPISNEMATELHNVMAEKLFQNVTKGIDNVQNRLLATENLPAEEKQKISDVMNQLKQVVKEKKLERQNTITKAPPEDALTEINRKLFNQEEILKACAEKIQQNQQDKDLMMDLLRQIKDELDASKEGESQTQISSPTGNESTIAPYDEEDKEERDIALCDARIKKNPNDDNAHNLRGKAYMKLGIKQTNHLTNQKLYYKEALISFNNAIRLQPSNCLYLCDRAKLYDLVKKPQLAVADFSKVNELIKINKGLGGDILNDYHIQNTLRSLMKLESFRGTLNNLRNKGQVTHAYFNAFDTLTAVSTELCVSRNQNDMLQLKEILGFIDSINAKLSAHQKITENDFKIVQQTLQKCGHKIEVLEVHVKEQAEIIQNSGMKEKAALNKGFKEVEEKDPKLHSYCKTLYWTLINLFGAYRSLSTGLIQGNIDYDESSKEKYLVSGARMVARYGTAIAKGMPFIGSIIGALDQIIDSVYGAVKENRLNNKVNAINKIIQHKFGQEDDISIKIGKLALAVTQAREQVILYPEIKIQTKFESQTLWLKKKIQKVKDLVLPSVELYNQDNHAAALALEDVVLIMAYLYRNCEEIIARKASLDQQFPDIIKYAGLEQILETAPKTEPLEGVQVFNERTNCCGVF